MAFKLNLLEIKTFWAGLDSPIVPSCVIDRQVCAAERPWLATQNKLITKMLEIVSWVLIITHHQIENLSEKSQKTNHDLMYF